MAFSRQLTLGQTCVVAIAGSSHGVEPFAVLDRLRGFSEERIKGHVGRVLGNHYTLNGVASLEQVGLKEFPVNATHKIIKPDVERAARVYAQHKTVLHIGALVSVAISIPLIVLRSLVLFWQSIFSLLIDVPIPRIFGPSLVGSGTYEKA